MKTLVLALALLSFAQMGCYVNQVSIKLDSDNASDLKCTIVAPTDDKNVGMDSKLKTIQTKAKAQGIYCYFAKQAESLTANGQVKTRFRYQVQAKLSTPAKAEKLSAIIAEVMKTAPDDFWYKVYAIEDNETEKTWQINFAFKPKARAKGEPQDFKLTVVMPQNVTIFSPSGNTATLKTAKQGKGVVFSYSKMETDKLYEFNVKASKKKPVSAPPEATPPVSATAPKVEKDTAVLIAPTVVVQKEEIPKEESKSFLLGLSVTEFAGLVTALATLLGTFVAIFKKKEAAKS